MSSARFTTAEMLASMEEVGMIPVFYHEDVKAATKVLKCAYAGGVRTFEFTNRGPNALSVFGELRKQADGLAGLALGIGTIMNAAQAETFIKAGADFIVSPLFKSEIADYGNSVKHFWIPGCATMTEIVTAMDAGAQLVKVFPGSVLGPAFIKSVLPVIPSAKLMPTGGVEPTKENLEAWFRAGVTCVGMGSQLFSEALIQDADALTNKVRTTVEMISTLRASAS